MRDTSFFAAGPRPWLHCSRSTRPLGAAHFPFQAAFSAGRAARSPATVLFLAAPYTDQATLRRQRDSNPRIPPGAVLYRLSYVCMRGVLVFPSRQIFSVPRFCQQITGAITTSRLEGLTSGLRITHTAVPLYARHSRCPRRIGCIGGDRTHDLLITNELLCQLSYDTGSPPCLRPGGRADVRQRGLRPRDRVPARIALGTPEEWM